ncbi:complement factor B-like isoform X2 [Sinocyclocheilus grahami]|uniref:complement factor B-like isoform X2 n=1 Tax=Sinocyclocheilus grahami TaxID=75366 RepID=UPI0007AD31A7|nr:PREDICTED: complement factor B-like isoform X2 [Sinocyclocheilus grahami]
MECKQRLKWLLLTTICPLIAGAPSSMSKRDNSCPKENLNITGGIFVLSKGYSHGSLLKYICPNGYYPSVQSRLCQDGNWTSKTKIRKTPECIKIKCPNPRVFENGEVIPYKEKYYVNDTTTYSCHSDCTFRGSEVRVCKPNGKWSGSTPICECDSDHCPDPGVPPGSSRTGNIFNIDNKVTYRCESPLTLIGSKVRVCLDGGQWSGTEPQCYADFTYDTPEEASEAFSTSLKSSLAVSQHYEKGDQQGKKITMDQSRKLDIYIAVDASGSIDVKDFENAKTTIKMLIDKISYYSVSPNYEILIFATDVTPIITMREFKNNEDARNLMNIFKALDDCNYESKGDKTGTNIAKAYSTILDSMKIEELNNATTFSETQHIVILFTDGQANMGGNPKRKVNQIKYLFTKNDPMREKNLDLYVFGIGDDVNQEDINGLVSQRDQEKYFFKLKDLTEVQEMFNDMIDESTSVGLCGIVWEGLQNKRRAFPWLAQINIQHTSSKGSNCMGSLVSSSYILTAASCFKEGDTPDRIIVQLEKDLIVKVKHFTLHPEYNPTAKQHMGIQEYYEFDVALIQLVTAVEMSFNLRPICIPCTRETNGALKLSDSQGTCRKHEEILMSNELVEAAFTSEMDTDNCPKNIKNITIKLGKYRDACVEDAKKAKGINVKNAREAVTDNFLCSGGNEPKTDDVACKGDSGGATYVNKKGRVIQVGVISWGVKDVCKEKRSFTSDADSRDYHSNLFSEKILSFLKKHLENDRIGQPLKFL